MRNTGAKTSIGYYYYYYYYYTYVLFIFTIYLFGWSGACTVEGPDVQTDCL